MTLFLFREEKKTRKSGDSWTKLLDTTALRRHSIRWFSRGRWVCVCLAHHLWPSGLWPRTRVPFAMIDKPPICLLVLLLRLIMSRKNTNPFHRALSLSIMHSPKSSGQKKLKLETNSATWTKRRICGWFSTCWIRKTPVRKQDGRFLLGDYVRAR